MAVNSAEDCRLASLIVQMQQWLADEWDWPTLEQWWDLGLVTGPQQPLTPMSDISFPTLIEEFVYMFDLVRHSAFPHIFTGFPETCSTSNAIVVS